MILAKKILILMLVVVFTGCSSTTLIRATDPQASIFIDNYRAGTGSATHTDTKIVGSMTTVRIEKPGCEPAFYTFSRSEEFDAGACAGGIFLLVPFLWIQKYKPERTYEYNCVSSKR
jgi:hypothetical protein